MSSTKSAFSFPKSPAPVAPTEEHTIEQLGFKRSDPYVWMKTENWRDVLKDPKALPEKIRKHLESENKYAQEIISDTEKLQETLFDEMKAKIPGAENSVPWPKDKYVYSRRFNEGDQYAVHIRQKRIPDSDPIKCSDAVEVLLNENERAQGKPYYKLMAAAISNDERFYAYAEDTQGSEIYHISILDLETKKLLPEVKGTTGSFVLDPTSEFIFWVERDEEGRPREVLRRALTGGEVTSVFKEENPGFFVNLSLSFSKKFILIARGDHETNETLIIPTDNIKQLPQKTAGLKEGVQYHLFDWMDGFVVLSNYDNRYDFAIFSCSYSSLDMNSWKEIIPHRPGHFIIDVDLSKNSLVWTERENGNCQIYSISKTDALDGCSTARQVFNAPDEAYALSCLSFLSFNSSWLRFNYQSPAKPSRCYDLNLETKELILRKEREVPSGFDPSRFEVHRLFATATDGAEIPITLLTLKGRKANGGPMLLYGYGSYGISMDPAFNTNSLSLIERGWGYAIAHIRGGADKGWKWFEGGRKEHKMNTFTDFVSAAKYLCETKWTSRKRIVAQGGSAGGLLMGAIANLAPDLFSGVIAQVPFVDTLNTMSDTDLPLTPPEWPEWGNPLEDKEAYKRIAAYSPYDNIKNVQYPPIFALGGLSDPRVTYWEPAKWIARLRAEAKGGPFLCKINMEAGHGGSSGRFGRLKETAEVYAFALAADANETQSGLTD